MLLAKDIRDRERGGRAEIKIIEGEAESDSPQDMKIMTEVLGQRSSVLPEGVPDATVDQEQKSKLTLYQWVHLNLTPSLVHVTLILCRVLFVSVSDAEGQMRVTEVATRPLSQNLLNHGVSFFFCYGYKFFKFQDFNTIWVLSNA